MMTATLTDERKLDLTDPYDLRELEYNDVEYRPFLLREDIPCVGEAAAEDWAKAEETEREERFSLLPLDRCDISILGMMIVGSTYLLFSLIGR